MASPIILYPNGIVLVADGGEDGQIARQLPAATAGPAKHHTVKEDRTDVSEKGILGNQLQAVMVATILAAVAGLLTRRNRFIHQ